MDQIILTGFMGAGKSSVGQIVASKLAFQFIDMDDYVHELAGQSISVMLSNGRLDLVRAFEAQAVNVLKKEKSVVISTGAGVMASEANARAFSETAFIVYIQRDFDTVYPIISNDPVRIIAYHKSYEYLRNLYKQRKPIYIEYADAIVENNESVDMCAESVNKAYPMDKNGASSL